MMFFATGCASIASKQVVRTASRQLQRCFGKCFNPKRACGVFPPDVTGIVFIAAAFGQQHNRQFVVRMRIITEKSVVTTGWQKTDGRKTTLLKVIKKAVFARSLPIGIDILSQLPLLFQVSAFGTSGEHQQRYSCKQV